ncbi:MAG: DNA adenine methylase [Bacteroidetes bacterium]|nr:DNA adenine methylase [Bacteroidota bacterium]
MLKSPLRYPGGKSRAAEFLCDLLPEFDEYREPFVGGGSVFFFAKQKFPDAEFWINDIYRELFLFWSKMQINSESVINQIIMWRNEFTVGKQLHRFLVDSMPRFDEVQTAAAFFIFNRITFSGTTQSGGFSEQAFSGRFTESSIQRLRGIEKLLTDTTITNVDYQEVVEKTGNKVAIFLDPPYYSATKSALYGKNGKLHTSFDHNRFAEVMKNCKHNWLITYDNSPFIKELFSFANIQEWNLMYGMRNVTKLNTQVGKELYISNY